MKYFYFLLVGLLTLVALYFSYGIVFLKWQYYQVEHPKANFQIIDNEQNNLTIVDFTNYRCGYCKSMHTVVGEALKLNKNVRYIPRPILFPLDPKATIKQEPVELERLVIAAGMQGKFQEMHNSFMEYPDGIIPEELIKETAELYNIDYERMIKDSQGEEVQKYLDDNMDDMLGLNIQSIPSYIIGKNIYVVKEGLPSLKDFLTMIANEEK